MTRGSKGKREGRQIKVVTQTKKLALRVLNYNVQSILLEWGTAMSPSALWPALSPDLPGRPGSAARKSIALGGTHESTCSLLCLCPWGRFQVCSTAVGLQACACLYH